MSEELENEGWIIEGGIITPEMSKKLCDDLRKWNRESHIKMFGGFTVEFLDLPDGTRRILN